MKCLRILSYRKVMLVAVLTFFQAFPPITYAKSALKMQKWEGAIEYSADGPSPFELQGNASHLGRFQAYGEVEFLPPEEDGSLYGEGIVVFEAANGDQLVGVLSWSFDAETGGGQIQHVSWRDSVEFSDGTVIASTGRFENAADRPPGVVVLEYLVLATILGLALIVGF